MDRREDIKGPRNSNRDSNIEEEGGRGEERREGQLSSDGLLRERVNDRRLYAADSLWRERVLFFVAVRIFAI